MTLAQDQVVETRKEVALALIKTYRALGVGWDCQCDLDSRCHCFANSSLADSKLAVSEQLRPGFEEEFPIE